jgi:hypothetical protein
MADAADGIAVIYSSSSSTGHSFDGKSGYAMDISIQDAVICTGGIDEVPPSCREMHP